MSLIQNISSTLKTWVFKKKLLRFSDRFNRDPQACFYCPEMCRFSCPAAETLRTNAVTPRGKMSLLHLAERGYDDALVAGSSEQRQWLLEQCTGCGRCTEYCVHEVDVASNLRLERAKKKDKINSIDERLLATLEKLQGRVLFCEPGRKEWWSAHPELLARLGHPSVVEADLPYVPWEWGKLGSEPIKAIGRALSRCRQIWVESPAAAWFLAKGVKQEAQALKKAEVRAVWQGLFAEIHAKSFGPEVAFHESFHLTRLLPRLDYSIPMYEKGFMPFHSGWNVIDCGGEGFYREAHPEHSKMMATRYLADLVKDGRAVSRIVCQSLQCVKHLEGQTNATLTYWLDELVSVSGKEP